MSKSQKDKLFPIDINKRITINNIHLICSIIKSHGGKDSQRAFQQEIDRILGKYPNNTDRLKHILQWVAENVRTEIRAESPQGEDT